ncbi:DEAD-box ATP-dependent RNA helicase 7-like [Cannabis sativa]|uniref:DEAD-box ATP-dependent RNA helicase 7-like n=1 Tax=Cannabis sativa TaxID=3483 RepID=UPI0029CA74E7|nr:DEAD-box ATP-dependent RNA helicase 7-like [Cannabis sativa]
MASPYGHIISDCKALLVDVSSVSFNFVKRSANKVAHVLAQSSLVETDRTFSSVTLPTVIVSLVLSGKFMTLVATNVATRGLDINDVQLIIQCEPPRNSGAAVMLYDPRRSNFSKIERESGVKFEHISAPQPADVAKAAGVEAPEIINQISDSVIPAFKAATEDLLNTSGLSAVEILSKALAKAAGYSEIKSRSLLTSMENCVTVLLEAGKPIYTPS